jgi:hypothetical protein
MPIHIRTTTPDWDYEVQEEVLAALKPFTGPVPDSMLEVDLVRLLRSNAVAYAERVGDPRAVLAAHMRNCVEKLGYVPGSAEQREMIGEILAAVRVRELGWTMVHGYRGRGHTGVDQLWVSPNDDQVLVVEAKGGSARLDTRQRYFEGCTHRGELGMNTSVTQMSAEWVFMGCNAKILKGMFGNSMLNDTPPLVVVLSPAQKAALRVCFALWAPADFQIHGGALHERQEIVGTVAPTRHFNWMMGWQGRMMVTLPSVLGAVVRNGEVAVCVEYVKLRHVLADGPPPTVGSGGGHRFQPSLLAQMRNQEDGL